MSILTTLRPDSADESGGTMTPNAGGAAAALSDDSDFTNVGCQLSTFEPNKHIEGTWGNLPGGVGRVNACTLRARADSSVLNSADLTMYVDSTGPFAGVARISVVHLPDTTTNYASASFSTYNTKPLVDALRWGLQADFVSNPGVQVRVYELYLDVDWDPAIGGFKGMIFSILGPLVAVGLHEMPGIAAELLRRSRTRIRPEEYARAWRELREPGRLYLA